MWRANIHLKSIFQFSKAQPWKSTAPHSAARQEHFLKICAAGRNINNSRGFDGFLKTGSISARPINELRLPLPHRAGMLKLISPTDAGDDGSECRSVALNHKERNSSDFRLKKEKPLAASQISHFCQSAQTQKYQRRLLWAQILYCIFVCLFLTWAKLKIFLVNINSFPDSKVTLNSSSILHSKHSPCVCQTHPLSILA